MDRWDATGTFVRYDGKLKRLRRWPRGLDMETS